MNNRISTSSFNNISHTADATGFSESNINGNINIFSHY